MHQDKEFKIFRQKWLLAIRKIDKYKYCPISKVNKFVERKWIKERANQEYSKYSISGNEKKIKVTFNDQNEIREFDKDLPVKQ